MNGSIPPKGPLTHLIRMTRHEREKSRSQAKSVSVIYERAIWRVSKAFCILLSRGAIWDDRWILKSIGDAAALSYDTVIRRPVVMACGMCRVDRLEGR